MQQTAGYYLGRSAGLLLALLIAWAITHGAGEHIYPIGWIYLSLFALAGLFSFAARGTYMWIAAVWIGAMLVVVFGAPPVAANPLLGAVVIGLQFLSAVLTGGLLGQWLRYRLATRQGGVLPLLPSADMLLVSGAFLLLLPVLAFLLLAGMSIENESLATILMFVPGQTPFLLPALLTGALCGYWVRQLSDDAVERRWASVLAGLSLALIALGLSLRFVFGFLEWHGLLPA